ncbi:ABC transporter substrate-binding protein [Methylobacterium organophilum]|uniref:HTH-type transcriptional regulator SgrR n=1 Tax=Methylobacterium organophilum TaxID=410 RepID=A0ABQ4TBU8_METOR|nr:ABC transporter substrate-binding protein [Methylobacterium organophilum]GJE27610.1 HTH-type transcriptional regulator SgrR [Methylobacterium organophilum]
MFRLKTLSGRPQHPAIEDLCHSLDRGLIGRRDFLRTAAWLGVSAASAAAFAGRTTVAAAAEAPKRGGSVRFACQIQEMQDPAASTYFEAANVFRNVIEYLTKVDADNVVHPYLAASWDPSADLKTWTFRLQPNVKWSNGDAFTSADVAANFRRWIGPASKSSNKTTFAALRDIEILGPLELRLHLDRPLLALPEMLYAPNTPIMHRDFEKMGGDWSKNPIGTGPYRLAEFQVGQKATLVRRTEYWGEMPYLDEIRFIDLGTDISTHLAALAAQQVDMLYRINVSDLDLAKRLSDVQILTGRAAQTPVMRMQVDQKPFDDIRVRQAVVLACDNSRILDVAIRGAGVIGDNCHVAPFQPEYAPVAAPKRDVEKAKHLLREAGHANGLDLAIAVGNTQGVWEQNTAQVLQQQCAEAGIRVKLDVMPAAQYWPIWNKVPFGLTYWAHRPLAVQTLDLAYRGGAAWNETHFADPAFDAALDNAMGIVDPQARKAAMVSVETILRDAALMVQPFWMNKYTAVASRVRGYALNPSDCFDLHKVWLA